MFFSPWTPKRLSITLTFNQLEVKRGLDQLLTTGYSYTFKHFYSFVFFVGISTCILYYS